MRGILIIFKSLIYLATISGRSFSRRSAQILKARRKKEEGRRKKEEASRQAKQAK
jgi:hypothetical protein